MHGHALAARHVAHNLLAANGVATSRAVDEQIVLALHLERFRAGELQPAHRVAWRRFARLDLRARLGFQQLVESRRYFAQHLVRGVLALAQCRQQIRCRGHAELLRHAAQVLVVDLRHWHFEFACLALQQLSADLDCPRSLVLV